jgi:hypothetical protein
MILYKTFEKRDKSEDILLLADMLKELRFSSRLDQYRFKVKIRYTNTSSILEAWITGTKETVSEIESVKAADIALKDLFRSIENKCRIANNRINGTDLGRVVQSRFGRGHYKGRSGKTHKRGR